MIGEIMSKQLIVVKADTSQAKAAIKELSAEEQKAAKARVEAQERHNAAMERSNQKFSLYAAGAAAGYAIISSSVKKYEEHLVSLGAKGETELKRLRDMTGGLTKAQSELQFAIARLALEAAPAAKVLGEMALELASILNSVGGIVRWAKDLPGAGVVGTVAGKAARYGIPVYGQVLGAKDAYNYFAGDDTVAPGRAFSRWSSMGEFGIANAEDQWRDWVRGKLTPGESPPPALRPPRARRGGGGRRSDPYADAAADIFGQINATSGFSSGRYSQADLDEVFGGGDIETTGGTPLSAYASDAARLSEELSKLMATLPTREESILHQIFGTPEEIDAQAEAMGYASQAVTVLADASSAAMQAWITGGSSLVDVFRQQIAAGLGAIAGDLAGKATRHLVEAAAHAVIGSPKAGLHLAAAGIYGAGALAVGSAAKAIHPNVKTPSGGYARAGGIGGGAGASSGPAHNANLTVVMGDGFADDSPRYKARRVRRAINQARNLYPESGATEQG